MREYITERVKNMTRHFKFGNIDVQELEPTPDGINLQAIFKTIENNFPSHYFQNLTGVKIGHTEEFDEREVNAVYRDGVFHISNRQDHTKDLMDDIVHEFAHHVETLFPEAKSVKGILATADPPIAALDTSSKEPPPLIYE